MIESNKLIKVVAPSIELGASGYYRIFLPLSTLRAQGKISAITRVDLPEKITREMGPRLSRILEQSDIFFLQREDRLEFVPILEKAISIGKKLIMDLDDHVFEFVSISNREVSEYWRQHLDGLKRVLRLLHGLIVTTDRMAKFYAARTDARVFVIPNFIDFDSPRWNVQKTDNGDNLIIGWMGGPTHLDDLAIIREPVKRILAKYGHVKFKVVGLVPDWVGDLPQGQVLIDTGYSSIDQYPARMHDFDIGLIPLQRNDFNDIGKSDIKVLEYGRLKIAPIVSRSPAYNVGKDVALQARDGDEFFGAMEALILDKRLRTSIAEGAYKNAKRRDITANCYRWLLAFRSIMGKT